MPILRGELYCLKSASLDSKPRPIVVISNNYLNGGHSVVAVPFYSQQLEKRKKQSFCAFFAASEGGLDRDCVAKCDEIGLVQKTTIDLVKGRIGEFDSNQMDRLVAAIKAALEID